MRWSKVFKKNGEKGSTALDRVQKVVVFGGGSFGTAMGVALARQKASLQITLLLRDPYICNDINTKHVNTRYMKVRCADWASAYMLVPWLATLGIIPEFAFTQYMKSDTSRILLSPFQ